MTQDAILQDFFSINPTSREECCGENTYCLYNDQILEFFTAIFYLMALPGSILGSHISNRYGCRQTMRLSGVFFVVGLGISCGSINLAMLFIGRSLIGIGAGLGSQAVPMYLAEAPPTQFRGKLASLFGMGASSGILLGSLVNLGVLRLPYGWRISFAIGIIPSSILTVGAFLVPDTPHHLIKHGFESQAFVTLCQLRKSEDVEDEFHDLLIGIKSQDGTPNVTNQPWRQIFSKDFRGELLTVVIVASLTQLSGLDAQVKYTPQILSVTGLGLMSALSGTAIIGSMFVLGSLINILLMDYMKRRTLLMAGSILMMAGQCVMAGMQGVYVPVSKNEEVPNQAKYSIIGLVIFVLAWAGTWGPISYILASEIQSRRTRVAGSALNVIVQFGISFILTMVFLHVLCALKWGTYIIFSAVNLVGFLYVLFILPETRGVSMERMHSLFTAHNTPKFLRIFKIKSTRNVSND